MKKFRKKNYLVYVVSMVLVLGIVMGVTLYKSHATFEVKKSFNIIEGKVPSVGDVKFAFIVDDEKSSTLPSKDSGYHLVDSNCNNDAVATWNELTWSANVSNLKNSGTICTLSFKKFDFNYGDGSLNTIDDGYIDKLYIYDLETSMDYKTENNSYYKLHKGNSVFPDVYSISSSPVQINSSYSADHSAIVIETGENENNLINVIKGDNKSFISIIMSGTSYLLPKISDFKLNLDGTYYTLKEALENEKIKPIVLMTSDTNVESYLIDKPFNMYEGNEISGMYTRMIVSFGLEKDVQFRSIKYNASKPTNKNYADGVSIYKFNNKIMHLK